MLAPAREQSPTCVVMQVFGERRDELLNVGAAVIALTHVVLWQSADVRDRKPVLGQERPNGLQEQLRAVIDGRGRVPGLYTACDVAVDRVLSRHQFDGLP